MRKKQTLKELREKDIKTLTKELFNLNEKLAKLRADLAFRKLKNVKQVFTTRKQIAQIWTILNEKVREKISNPPVGGEVVK